MEFYCPSLLTAPGFTHHWEDGGTLPRWRQTSSRIRRTRLTRTALSFLSLPMPLKRKILLKAKPRQQCKEKLFEKTKENNNKKRNPFKKTKQPMTNILMRGMNKSLGHKETVDMRWLRGHPRADPPLFQFFPSREDRTVPTSAWVWAAGSLPKSL